MRGAHRAAVVLMAGLMLVGPAALSAAASHALTMKTCSAKGVNRCCGSATACSCRSAPEDRRESTPPAPSPRQSQDDREQSARLATAASLLSTPALTPAAFPPIRSTPGTLTRVHELVVLRC